MHLKKLYGTKKKETTQASVLLIDFNFFNFQKLRQYRRNMLIFLSKILVDFSHSSCYPITSQSFKRAQEKKNKLTVYGPITFSTEVFHRKQFKRKIALKNK